MHKYYRCNDIEESVAWARQAEERSKSLVLWGTKYNSLSEIAKNFGVNLGSMRARMKPDNSLEEIVKELLIHETIFFNGKEYSGISELATAYGKDVSLVFGRLSYGFDLERALHEPVRKIDRPELEIEYQGKWYKSKRHLFRELGISGYNVYEMMRNYDVEFETAVDIYHECKKRMGIPMERMITFIPVCIIRDKEYRSVVQLLNELKISESTVATYKSRNGYVGILETLQAMQKEMQECYEVDGQKKTYKEMVKMGYTSTTYKQVPKKLSPRYPQLQGLDLVTGCIDTMKIYEEVKEEKLNMEQGMRMNM